MEVITLADMMTVLLLVVAGKTLSASSCGPLGGLFLRGPLGLNRGLRVVVVVVVRRAIGGISPKV